MDADDAYRRGRYHWRAITLGRYPDPVAPPTTNGPEPDDDELRALWRFLHDPDSGTPDEVERAHEAYGRVIAAIVAQLVRRYAPRGTQAEDVEQDTWISVLRYARSKPESPAKPSGFLYFRVRAVLKEYGRQADKEKGRRPPPGSGPDPDEIDDPDEPLEERELREAYENCLDRLSDRERDAWDSRPLGDLDEADVAKKYNTTVNAIRISRTHAAKKVKACLVEKEIMP